MQEIQVAIQGGGAKIWALLAAIEALQELESEQVLKVTRMAGTSAGAIAACIFAGRIDAKLVRTMLKTQFGKDLARLFPKPTRTRILKLLILGSPLWKERALGEFLAKLFGERHLHYLDDLKIPTFIIAANLNTNQKIVHKDHFQIVQALLDSAGIPFCFRTWRHDGGSVVVDGGLCENLPLEELVGQEKQYGRVAAISFDPIWTASPSNAKDFSVALLDTAINNSIERAKQRLGREATFSTDPKVGTFEFSEALQKLEEAYDLVKYKARDFFKKFVTKPQRVVGDPWSVENLQFMKKLGQVYNAQHRTPVQYDYCRLFVQANSLLETPAPDNVHYLVKIRTLASPLYCYRIALIESTNNPTTAEEAEWEVFGPDSQPVKTVHLPMVDPETRASRELLLFFDPPLKSNSGPYTIHFRDKVSELTAAMRSGKDELGWSTKRAQGRIGRLDLVLYLPRQYHASRLVGRVGARIPDEELAEDAGEKGMIRLGWRGENIDPLQNEGVFLADVYVEE